MIWYQIILLATSVFIVAQSIISLLFGDIDMDTDVGGDLSISDVFSFKGGLHVLFGFSLTLTLFNNTKWYSLIIATVVGLLFALLLGYIYRFVHKKLKQEIKYTEEINNIDAEVYFWNNDSQSGSVFLTLEGRIVEIYLKSEENITLNKGDKIKVSGTRNLVYYNK